MINRDDAADDATLQLKVIEEIALESGQPISEVTKIYEAEFARLKANAHIRDYLPLFASRRTREVLLHRGGQKLGSVRGDNA